MWEDTDHGYSQRLNTETSFSDHRLLEQNDNRLRVCVLDFSQTLLLCLALQKSENKFKHNNLCNSIGCYKKIMLNET